MALRPGRQKQLASAPLRSVTAFAKGAKAAPSLRCGKAAVFVLSHPLCRRLKKQLKKESF
jgi:hypothetical protein